MQFYLSESAFQQSLADPGTSRENKLLLILFWKDETPKSVVDIKNCARDNGFHECTKWNVSSILGRAKGRAITINNKWRLTVSGKNHLFSQNLINQNLAHVAQDVNDLRNHLSLIANTQTKAFIAEAISCLEHDQKKAAVVFSWIGAIAVLYDEVVKHHLAAFNAEATKRDAKWKTAKNSDELAKMKEFDFLNIIEAISIIGKNVKQELQNCLQLRNGCGHPNSLQIGTRKVAAHIETLILNVFSKV